MSEKNVSRIGIKIIKYAFVFFAIAIGLIILSTITKTLFAYGIYAFFLEKVTTIFGLDLVEARTIAIFLTIVSLLALPSVISLIFLGRRKKEVLLMILVATTICFLSMHYGTENVFFDRGKGPPIKFYAKTLEGFKFSSSEDFDPKFGIRFKPITPEVVKEYYFWKETGKLRNIPEVEDEKYFDMLTGDPIVWYSERPGGKIMLFSLPGYDPMTGRLLKPITSEAIKRKRDEISHLTEQSLKPAAAPEDGLINRIKYGEINEDWYFNIKENVFWLEHPQSGGEWEYRHKHHLFGDEHIHKFGMFAEKIIFISPDLTIIGICFQGTERQVINGIGSIYVLDIRGIKHKPVRYAGTEVDNDGDLCINLNNGEKKRVFLMFDYISPEKLKSGQITWGNGSAHFANWQIQ